MSQTQAEVTSAKIRISANQWKGFIGAFGGWALDGFNQSIFGLVLAPAMTELLPKSGYPATPQMIGYFGQLGVAIFLAGWGCSFVWGPVADRKGRVPALMYSVLVYAIFTCLAGFSQNIWELFLFRFMAAVGIGGEWAMAGTLVAETMPEQKRPFFGGLLHSGVFVGLMLGAVVNYVIGIRLGWRWMFFLGLIPALFVLYIRSQTKEPERWVRVSGEAHKTPYWAFLVKILRPPYRRRTWINVVLLFIALTGFWAGSQYLGAAIVNLGAQQGMGKAAALHLASLGLGLLSVLSIAGCLLVPWLGQWLGRRSTLALMFALMFVGIAGGYGWGYYAHSTMAFFAFIPVLGLANADFAVFTLWLPEQYNTDVRATAFAFCTTMSRFIAAAGTFLVGYAISQAHTIGYPLALTALPFLLGIWLCYLAPETRGQTLPQ
ncbi:MAG TPA: MFS transporter [Patescibacteria group bacterium]|nr:MFS transporter [Patescibacteria group bacterium]